MGYATTTDAKRVRELCGRLDEVTSGARLIVESILTDFATLLGAPAMSSYAIGIEGTHASVEWMRTHGLPSQPVESLRELLNRTQFSACAYSPLRPDPRQRNRPLTFADIAKITGRPGVPAPFVEFLTRSGYARCDQLRTLICDGPALLLWIGAYRPEPFTAREKRIFSAVAPSLQRRLRWERHLGDAALGVAALEAALEQIPAPAFVVSRAGRVVHHNHVGAALLEADRARTTAMLLASVQSGGGSASVTRLAVRGVPSHALVLLPERPHDLAARLRAVAARWKLTQRQIEVIELLAQGFANKSIAAVLGCAAGTAELHVSAILSKAGVESRAELVALFWRMT